MAFACGAVDHELQNPKMVLEGLAGCCGQMDVQAKDGEFWVAHNGKHLVEHFDRDGQKLSSFGKTDRMAADGFGGCCEPKNLRFGPENVLYACESGPPTCVKRFSTDGKFLGVAAIAPWDSGCVRVTTEVSGDGSRLFVLNSDANAIHVFAEKKAETAEELAKTIAEARKKVAEAKSQFDEAKAKMDEAKAKMDEAKAKMDDARKEMLEATKKASENKQVENKQLVIRRLPAVTRQVGHGHARQPQLGRRSTKGLRGAETRRARAARRTIRSGSHRHEPAEVIKFSDDPKNPVVNSFCLNGEGNLLVCCGGTRYEFAANNPSGVPT